MSHKNRGGAAGPSRVSVVGRGFSLDLKPDKFEAVSTLAQDVEEVVQVRSRNDAGAARLWALLREGDPRRADRLSGEVEQLDFAELPAWLRKHGIDHDLERSWQDPAGPAKAASRQARVRLRCGAAAIWVAGPGGKYRVRTGSVSAMRGYPGFSPRHIVVAAGLAHGVPCSYDLGRVLECLRMAALRVVEDQRQFGARGSEVLRARRQVAASWGARP